MKTIIKSRPSTGNYIGKTININIPKGSKSSPKREYSSNSFIKGAF